MLFEQSGSVWLWWVCISRLESEGGRGGWAFVRNTVRCSPAVDWSVLAHFHGTVWSGAFRNSCGDTLLLSNAAKKVQSWPTHFLGAQAKYSRAAAGTFIFQQSGPSALATSSGQLVFQCQSIPHFIGCHCLSRVWRCSDQPRRRSAAILGV